MKYTTQAEMHEYLTDKHFPHTYAHMVYNDLFENSHKEQANTTKNKVS